MASFTKLEPVQLVLIDPDPAVGLAPAATGFTFGPYSLKGFLNGRLRGSAHQDVGGMLLVEFGDTPTNFSLAYRVTRDLTQADFQYPFDIIVLQPFLRVSFTNGAGASAFFRANLQALPL